MIVTAPAKINLTLSIIGKRPDGYHALESVMQQLSLSDTITIEEADDIDFTCADAGLLGENNLVVRAARLLQSQCPTKRGARLHLEKHIPIQAGLGGGSSDAATVLAALNEFWEVRLPFDTLMQLAAQLGSDVPFFLNAPTGIARGRGEDITPIMHRTVGYVVLAKPAIGLSTPQVYAKLHAPTLSTSKVSHRNHPVTQAMISALQANNLEAVARSLHNDLEGPALAIMPALFPLRERMLEAGCQAVLLSGSGSALFGICPDEATAQHAALDLTNDFPWTWAGPWLIPR